MYLGVLSECLSVKHMCAVMVLESLDLLQTIVRCHVRAGDLGPQEGHLRSSPQGRVQPWIRV